MCPGNIIPLIIVGLLVLALVGTSALAEGASIPDERENPDHWEVHAALMTVAVLLYFTSAVTVLLERLDVQWWKWVHVGTGVLATILAGAGVALGWWMVDRTTTEHFSNTHSFLVAVGLALVFAPLVTGLVAHLMRGSRMGVRWAHIILGLLGAIVMVVGIVTGLGIA